MALIYGLTEEFYSFGSDSRIAYGIAAYDDVERDGQAAILLSIHDITPQKERMVAFVQKCNQLKLSILHLHDAVDDFLVE